MKTNIDFRTLACVCKYSHWAYDENHETIQACNHKDNMPPRHSWGVCCEKNCPLDGKAEPIRNSWLMRDDGEGLRIVCSRCGKESKEEKPFCAECGAMMDGGTE